MSKNWYYACINDHACIVKCNISSKFESKVSGRPDSDSIFDDSSYEFQSMWINLS